MKKFGADLGDVGGHIFIDDSTFTWKPVRFLFFGKGIQDIIVPLQFIEGYKISGLFLYIHIKGEDDMLGFYTFKAKSIIEAIKEGNPYIRMYE